MKNCIYLYNMFENTGINMEHRFLDETGLQQVWNKISLKFESKEELAEELDKYYTKEQLIELLSSILLDYVKRSITGENGEALIFNEADGGGAKYIHKDGSEVFIGVNDGGIDGLMAQIYADIEKDGRWSGSRINVCNDRIYYTNQEAVDSGVVFNDANHEIAIKEDLESKIDINDTLILNCNP